MTARSFAFRPRYRALAWSSMGVGGTVATVAAILGFAAVPLASGVLGIALGAAYLASPTWKLTVIIDEDGLTVTSPKRRRFQLAWAEVVRVVASPSTSTCFVDGGAAERSLLVPGPGAPAPYAIADRQALVAAILAHVPADKIQTVTSLDAVDPTTDPTDPTTPADSGPKPTDAPKA